MKSYRDNGGDRMKLRYQDKAYNESYRQWRKKNKNAAVFYFDENPGQLTYREGFGFIDNSAEAHQARALKQALFILGAVLLARSFFDIFTVYFLPGILQKLGADISYDLFTNKLYGSELLIITETFLADAVSVILPVIFIAAYFKLPVGVMAPMKITNKPMFGAAVPFAVLISGVSCSMLAIFSSVYRVSVNSVLPAIPRSPGLLAYLILTHVVIVPVVSEFCSGGAVLQFMRQFGDDFALVVTSFITAAFSYDIMQFLFYFTVAISIRYFTIRTGSLLTGMIMRLTVSVYSFILYFISFSPETDNRRLFVMLYILITLAFGIIFAVYFLYRRSDCFNLVIRSRIMPFKKKMRCALTSVTIIIWFAAVLIMMMMRAVFAK